MFDPLFPIAMFCGPLALAVLLRIEANHSTRSIWPRLSSALLALAAMWGLTYWGLMIGVLLFGEGMKESELDQLIALAIAASVALVAGCYWLVVRHRAQELSR